MGGGGATEGGTEDDSPNGDATKDDPHSFSAMLATYARDFLKSAWVMIQQLVVGTLSVLWTSCTDVIAPLLWGFSWIAKTSFGQWIANTSFGQWISTATTRIATMVKGKLGALAQRVLTYVMGWLPASFVRWLGLNPVQNVPAAENDLAKGEDSQAPSNESAAMVQRLFQALSPQASEIVTVTNTANSQEAETPVTAGQLICALSEAFAKHQSDNGADFDRAVDGLIGRFRGGSQGSEISDEDKMKLREKMKQGGTAKALFDFLYDIAAQKASPPPAGSPTATALSKGALLHQQMQASNANYSRLHTKFFEPPTFDQEKVTGVVRQMSEHLGHENGKGIQQNLTSEKIQADIEKFIREGDQQGLIEYVRQFLDTPMPEEFAQNPSMAQKWRDAKETEARAIAAKLQSLVENGWSQLTDGTVAQTTNELVKLMSESVCNLWVEGLAEALIDQSVAADKAIFLEWSEQDKAYSIIEEDGKYKTVVNRAAMGEIHESYIEKMLRRCGYEIVDAKLPGNTGIDILAVKRNAAGEVVRILVVECKATMQEKVNNPRLSNTKKGKQLSNTWIAEKITKMYKQGGDLREKAILLRKNLAKAKPVVAFQKNGINSWAHQNRVPEFHPEVVEEIVQKNLPEWKVVDTNAAKGGAPEIMANAKAKAIAEAKDKADSKAKSKEGEEEEEEEEDDVATAALGKSQR